MSEVRPDLTMMHFTYDTGGDASVLSGVERVIDSQVAIFRQYGYHTRVIVGRTDLVRPDGFNLVVVPQITSGRYQPGIHGAALDDALGEIQAGLAPYINEGALMAHNTTNAFRHNHPFGVVAADLLALHAANGLPAVLAIHDSRKAPPEALLQYIPTVIDTDQRVIPRIACVSNQRRVALKKRLAELRAQGATLFNYEIEVLPNPIDIKFFEPAFTCPQTLNDLAPQINMQASTITHRDEAERLLIQETGVPMFLCPARVVEQKGIEHAITVANEIGKQLGQKVILVISGRLDARRQEALPYWADTVLPTLQKVVEDPGRTVEVLFLNGVNWEYMVWLYERATMLLLPFENEGFGLPIIEGGLRGKMALASKDSAMRETAGRNSLRVGRRKWLRNPVAVARDALKYLVSGKINTHRRAIKDIAQRYHPQTVEAQLCGLLEPRYRD